MKSRIISLLESFPKVQIIHSSRNSHAVRAGDLRISLQRQHYFNMNYTEAALANNVLS